MAIQVETLQLQFRHGHTDDKVLVVITPRPVDHFELRLEEAEEFIQCMQDSVEKLSKHIASRGKPN